MATYYVAQGGTAANKAAADGSGDASTFMSVATHNSETFSAGDTIVLNDAGGDFTSMIETPSSGSSGAPITYRAADGDTPTIDGDDTLSACFRISAEDYITVDGLTLSGWTDRGIYATNAEGVVIKNCTISGGSGAAPAYGIQVQATDNSLYGGCEITDNTIGTIHTTELDTVFYNGILVQGVTGAVIARNDISTTNTVGVRLILATGSDDNTGCTIEDNDVHGCYGGILVFNTDSSTIQRNKIRDGKGLGIGINTNCVGLKVLYNQIFNLATASTNLWNGIDINSSCTGGFLYGNSIYKVHRYCLMIDGASSGWTIKNNVFDATENTTSAQGGASPKACIGIRDNGLSFTSDYNCLIAPEWASNVEKITNGSFETFTGTEDDDTSDTFTGWSYNAGTGGAVEAVTVADANLASIPSGTYAIKMKQATSGIQTLTTTASLTSDKKYRLSFSGQYNGSHNWRMAIYTGGNYLQDNLTWAELANWDVLTGSDASWAAKSVEFTTPSTGTYTFRIENLYNTGDAYFDNFSLVELGEFVGTEGDGDGDFFVFDDWQSTLSQDANSINNDPLFTDPDNGDLTLQPGSPCIGAGTDLGASYDDALHPSSTWPDGVTTVDQDDF